MAELLELEDARWRVAIVPALGGGIALAEAKAGGGAVPVLRPWAGPEGGVLAMGCNLLVPFSNRISGGGFTHDGEFHALEPNMEGEPYPIHGDGFFAVWEEVRATETLVRLRHAGRMGDFEYDAAVVYELGEAGLSATLEIVNRGAALPFGGGFHPWFPRSAGTRLTFQAEALWEEHEDHLPRELVAIDTRPEWDFRQGAPLPEGFINNAFPGWDGTARIAQPAQGIEVTVTGGPELTLGHVYSPEKDADFFCFEPVSHAVDAHNAEGQPGLAVLAPGERLSLRMGLAWRPLDAA